MEPLLEDTIVDIAKDRERSLGASGKMLLPCPATVEALLRQLPEEKLITIDLIRQKLADQFNVQTTCPFNTKLCLRALANDPAKNVAYWRVVRGSGELIDYFPGGAAGHAALLSKQGFVITYGGKKPKVMNLRENLVKFGK
jgi:hypothetical protein